MKVPKTHIKHLEDNFYQLELYDEKFGNDSEFYHWFSFSRRRLITLKNQIEKVLQNTQGGK